jgi:hypothetical protein
MTEFIQGSYELVVAAATEAREQASKQAVSSRSTEEYKKSTCEDITCNLETLFVLHNAVILEVCGLWRLL